jgi:hypothetical protein
MIGSAFDDIKDDLIQVHRGHGGDLVEVYHAEQRNDKHARGKLRT